MCSGRITNSNSNAGRTTIDIDIDIDDYRCYYQSDVGTAQRNRARYRTRPFQDGGRRRGRWPPGPGVFAGRKRETGLRGSDRNRGCARIDLRTDPGQEQQQQLVTSSSLANAMQCKERVSDCKERPKSRASGTYSNAIQYNAMPQYNTKAATIPDCDDSIVPHYYSVLRCVIATSNDISYHIIPYHTIPYHHIAKAVQH